MGASKKVLLVESTGGGASEEVEAVNALYVGGESEVGSTPVVQEDGTVEWVIGGGGATGPTGPTGATGPEVSWNTHTVEIAALDWSDKSVTKTVAGVTAASLLWISPAPASYDDYTAAQIRSTAQGVDSITFVCEATPSSAITVNVIRAEP